MSWSAAVFSGKSREFYIQDDQNIYVFIYLIYSSPYIQIQDTYTEPASDVKKFTSYFFVIYRIFLINRNQIAFLELKGYFP